MRTMKNIEIHGVDPRGERFVLNHFSNENAGLNEAGREKLFDAARRMSFQWQAVFPDCKIFVTEV